MTNQERVSDLYQQMNQGNTMEAFDKYYHEDVRVIEMPRNEIREGKEAQREAIGQWQNMVEAFHGGGVEGITSDEKNGITMVESWMDISMQGGHRTKMQEVAVQRWKDGKIIEERFYYHDPMPVK